MVGCSIATVRLQRTRFVIVAGSKEPCNPSKHFFANVQQSSPNLHRLHLIKVNLMSVPIGALPVSLESLAITGSYVPSSWFQDLSDGETVVMPRLRELDLSRSSKTCDANVSHIVRAWPGLNVLKLSHCYRLTVDGLSAVATLRQLEVLELDDTACNGATVHQICRSLSTTLHRLSVAECRSFTDGCAATVSSMLTSLQSLDVSGCRQLTGEGLLSFTQLEPCLQHLDVSSTAINTATLTQLSTSMPACDIVHEA